MQTTQSKCIRYCLQLDNRSYIEMKDFALVKKIVLSDTNSWKQFTDGAEVVELT